MSILFLSLISETFARWIAQGFKKVFTILGNFNSRVILSVFYLGFLLPISLIRKAFTKKNKNKKETNWINTVGKEYNFKEPW